METTETVLTNTIAAETEQAGGVLAGIGGFFRAILPSLGFAVFLLVCGIVLIRLFMKVFHRTMEKSRIDKTAGRFLESLISVLLYILVVVIVLSVLRVPMTSIITVIGTMGLAIGLALQNSLANVAGGFLLLFSKPLKVGDFVEFEGISGTVMSVGILQTKIITPDGTTVFIPNGKLSDAVVKNYSETPQRRVDLNIGISYDSDIQQAKALVEKCLERHPYTITEPLPIVRIGEMGDSAVILHVRVWTTQPHYWEVYYDLHELIYAVFRKYGISFPYPQLDVHTDRKGDCE
ncbi:MAG: mechanosensitive ion channel family protein [Oscillospiraceae bacterium]|nr:mechanosensitive ion channel family protein [Oscillospiraceae bacterium]